MIISTLSFWEGLTNTFQLRCGMITPTLFDMALIYGLRPTCDTFNPTLKSKIKPKFLFTQSGFDNYIEDHHEDTIEVFDYEHISFLTLWLSHFIFCSGSL